MDNWQKMFEGVQTIAQSAKTMEDGLNLTVEFARSDVRAYDDPEYWKRVLSRAATLPLDTLSSWAREGLERLDPSQGWDFLIADFGDCPETFRLYKLGCQPLFDEDKFRRLSFSESIIAFGEFTDCFATRQKGAEKILYSGEQHELTEHNVQELEDEILTWNTASVDFNGDNGYLLWLALGSLALLAPLRDAQYCNKILRGRQRLYLLSGFEEIFFYLATVTPEGLRFEQP